MAGASYNSRPGSRVVTLEEQITGNRPCPTLVLRYPPAAGRHPVQVNEGTVRGRESVRHLRDETARMSASFRHNNEMMINEFKQVFKKDKADAKKTKKNVEKFQEQRQKTKAEYLARYDQLTQIGLQAMEQMRPEQQVEFMAFWDQIGQFLVNVLDWCGQTSDAVAKLILEGHSIDADVSKKLFAKAYEAMDSVSLELDRFFI